MAAELLQEAINGLAESATDYALALSSVSVFAMALVETWKRITGRRDGFQAAVLSRWMPADAFRELLAVATAVRPDQIRLPVFAGKRLALGRRSDRPEEAFFALDLTAIVARIRDAAEIAILQPVDHPHLFAFLAGGTPGVDVTKWEAATQAPRPDGSTDTGQDYWADHERLQRVAVARINAFGLATQHTWAWRNRGAAMLTGAILMFVALWQNCGVQPASGQIAQIALISCLGGALAPYAKDLAASIENLRSGK